MVGSDVTDLNVTGDSSTSIRPMPIDRSGPLWKGTEPLDIDEFLTVFAPGGYPVERTVHSRCANCQGSKFALRVDDEAGYADRRCLTCHEMALMLDSEDSHDDATPEECACPCGGEAFELAVGFAMVDVRGGSTPPDQVSGATTREVKWVSVGARCLRDGALGVYTDWKIDYAPTTYLFDRA
jgi:hypothetical protein